MAARGSVGRVAVEELVDIHVVDAGEGAGRQDGQDVAVGPGRWPGLPLPALGEGGGGALAALAVRAQRPGPDRGLPAAEPAGVAERHAEGDREPGLARL